MFYTKNSVIKTHFTYKPIVISICNYSFNNVTLIYFFPILVKQACELTNRVFLHLLPIVKCTSLMNHWKVVVIVLK